MSPQSNQGLCGQKINSSLSVVPVHVYINDPGHIPWIVRLIRSSTEQYQMGKEVKRHYSWHFIETNYTNVCNLGRKQNYIDMQINTADHH